MNIDVIRDIQETVQDVFTDMQEQSVTQILTYHSIDQGQSYNPETGEFESTGPGMPTYLGLVVNPEAQGSDVFDLQLSENFSSPGGNPLLGWTVEISDDAATYRTMDLSTASPSIYSTNIRVSLASWSRGSIQSNKSFRVSYDAGVGDIINSFDSSPLATFTNDVTFTNNSNHDLVSDIEDWWKLEEAVDTTRLPEVNAPGGNYDLDDVNSVGVRTDGPDGNAADFTGLNYLITTIGDAGDPHPTTGEKTVAYYMKVDTRPSVKDDGNAYPVHNWRANNDRNWATLMQTAPNDDVLFAIGYNDQDAQFHQIAAGRGAFPTDAWYLVVASYDPLAAVPVIVYTCKLNTISDFLVDDDNYVAPSSGDPKMKTVGGAASFVIGKFANFAPDAGFDGGVDTVILYDRALTEAEARDMAYQYGTPPFDPVP